MTTAVRTPTKPSKAGPKGWTTPRLFTPPLRQIGPHTSLGYAVLEWALTILGWTPMPWQKWLITHALEILPGTKNTLRFSKVLLLVARQNGKSEVVSVLALYWLVHGELSILYSSHDLKTAKDQWQKICNWVLDDPDYFGKPKISYVNGQWSISLPKFEGKPIYEVVSPNRKGGRGKTADRVLIDELREHHDFEAMDAADSTTLTKEFSQTWMTSNAGDARSVVLSHYRSLALSSADPELFHAEWSAHEDCDVLDPSAWYQANPAIGFTITIRKFKEHLSKPVASFKTEQLCIAVPSLSEAISPTGWASCLDPGSLDTYRRSVVASIDISLDSRHVTLMTAAQIGNGRVRVEVVETWESVADMLSELPELLLRVRPVRLVWYPTGPAAGISTEMKALPNNQELTGQEINAACMELAEMVSAGKIAHNGDALLSGQLLGAGKLRVGDGWRFSRRDGWCDAAYATAAVVHVARIIPMSSGMKLIRPRKQPIGT